MDNLTTLPGVPGRSEAVPGMAHFKGTGPAGTTCAHCAEYRTGKEIDKATEQKGKCHKYRRLMGKWGPAVDRHTPSCKYYKARE